MYTICSKRVKYPKALVTILQLILTGHNNFIYYQKFTRIHIAPPGRPIVSGSGGPTEKISQFMDHFIGPLVPLSQSYIRDLTHLINRVNKFIMQQGMLMCTLDTTGLYTNIPHDEGTESIKEMLAIHKPSNRLPHNSYIIELLEVVLTSNHFEFKVNTTIKYQELQWVLSWQPDMPTYLWPNLRRNIYTHILYNQNYGKGL